MRSILVTIAALAALGIGCMGNSEQRACMKECPIEVMSVCGVDGKNYDNKCEAGCMGVEVAYANPCKIDDMQ